MDQNPVQELNAMTPEQSQSPEDPSAAYNLQPGGRLGPYQILGAVGAGGMGQVFRARDTRLDRTVAIKVSAARFSGRFDGEARAVASLNHPNICTLYDVGPNYLVMEYVEGATLQQMLRPGRLPVDDALRYAGQIAAAMAAAHAAGIVHRDLKPGNVMVNRAGLVKVLDFGLAKMTQPIMQRGESEATATLAAAAGHTGVGGIVGSPMYMSPEQALSKAVDARSDIFSFGLLLYEMLAGRTAFRGSTLEVLAGILHAEAPPLGTVNPAVGDELTSLVARCLRKDAGQRFQSMAEVQRELEALAKPKPKPTPKPRWLPRIGIAAAVLGLAAASLLVWRKLDSASPDDMLGAPEITRVTSDPGLNIDPALSLDGKLVAYASDRSGEGNLDIWVKQIGGGDPIRLTRDAAGDVEPSFSPDGTHVVFRSARDGGGLYIVPTTGGDERKIADGGRRPRFSPDGTKVAYWTGLAHPFPLKAGSGRIFILELATSTTRQLRADFAAAVDPVWSPDGKKILFVGAKGASDPEAWWIASLNDKPAVLCSVMPVGDLFDPFAWQSDRVYFEWDGAGPTTISRMTINAATGQARGKPSRLTAATADAHSPSVSSAGQTVFAGVDKSTNLYSLSLEANTGKTKSGLQRLSRELGLNTVRSISADGMRLAFLSNRTGGYEVWGKDLSTGREQALTEGGNPKTAPDISWDGRFVAWKEAYLASREAFVTPFDGGATQRLCSDCGAVQAWTPDGRFLLFDLGSAHKAVGLMEFASGKVVPYLKSSNLDLHAKSVSSDGKWIAFAGSHSSQDFTVYVAPFAPERAPPPAEWIEVLSSPDVNPNPGWSPDGNLLYFSSERDGHNCIWAQRLNRRTKRPEGKLFPIQHFHAPSLLLAEPSSQYPLALAADKVVVSLEERSGGIWMMKLQGDR
jgi:Tol biopolymer transport system component/predicted Ser/Thr protein kinase